MLVDEFGRLFAEQPVDYAQATVRLHLGTPVPGERFIRLSIVLRVLRQCRMRRGPGTHLTVDAYYVSPWRAEASSSI